MKKLILVMCLLFLVVMGATANGSKETIVAPSTAPSVDYTVKEPIKIIWWHALEKQYSPLVDEIVGDFNKSQNLITVEPVYIGNYKVVNEQLVTVNAAGQGLPAITVSNAPYIASYGANGLTEDLTPYMKASGYDINDFFSGMRDAVVVNGKQMGLPFLISTQTIYYNKDELKRLGLTFPTQWDQMEEYLKAVTEFNPDGTTKRYGMVFPGWDEAYFETFFLNQGVQMITKDNKTDLNGPAAKKVTEDIARWVKKGYVYWATGKDASSIMRGNFVDGKAFSVLHTISLYDMYRDRCKFEVGMAWLPGGATHQQGLGGSMLLIPAKNDQATKNAAWVFMQYLCSKDVNLKWASGTGYLPTRNSVLTTKEADDYLAKKPEFKVILSHLSELQPRIQNKNFSQMATIWRNYLEKIFNIGVSDIKTELDTMAGEMNEVLAD